MAGRTDGLCKGFTASGAVGRHCIVKFGASDQQVSLAAAAADLSIGVSTEIDAADGEPCDVFLDGIAEVIYGGNVARGQKLTSDAGGHAVAAAPGAGTNNHIVGIAIVGGVSGDIGSVLVVPSVMQG